MQLDIGTQLVLWRGKDQVVHLAWPLYIFTDSDDGKPEKTEEGTDHRCYHLVCSSWCSDLGQGTVAVVTKLQCSNCAAC